MPPSDPEPLPNPPQVRPAPALAAGAQGEDTALRAVVGVAMHYRIRADAMALSHELGLMGRQATSNDIVRATARLGLQATILSGQNKIALESAVRPAILRLHNGRYAILGRRQPPNSHEIYYLTGQGAQPRSIEEILEEWAGELVLITRADPPADLATGAPPARFGLSWFLPSLWRYRRSLMHVLLASLFVQLFALITPLFFLIVIDKVLIHQSLSTLTVVIFGMMVLGLFDVVLQYLRAYTTSHTASRLDVELGRKVFAHLMKLPLDYFATRPVGQTVARMRELETIRAFLTGQGITSLLDVLFTVVFLIVLCVFSLKLTAVVLGAIPLYVLVGFLIRPLLREKVRERFLRSASSQQFLVESVVGAYTLKAAAVEPLVQAQWDEKLAAYVKTSFQSVTLGNISWQCIQYVSKLTTALILYFGALEVIGGDMTVGSLVAFNMIANQATAPILRLSQLWQDFQQVKISVDRVGDILNSPAEVDPGRLEQLPAMVGRITFHDVVFRYRAESPDVLRGMSLDIAPGEVVGIVGPSGSGKSTLTKLIQRLYVPQQGRITVDCTDIAKVHAAWLRQQISVVLQENLLFNRTVHDNIALATPLMSREQVIRLARLAGADEFISQMPQGYDTRIEERGMNLSGGQRQRIAIARALARNPRVLILDEATSALDYESERIIQSNMKEIVRGRTVVIIAHRLAAVRNCSRIISIVNGQIVEDGRPDDLLKHENGLYRRLWLLQNDSTRL